MVVCCENCKHTFVSKSSTVEEEMKASYVNMKYHIDNLLTRVHELEVSNSKDKLSPCPCYFKHNKLE